MKARLILSWIFLFFYLSYGFAQFGEFNTGGSAGPAQQAEVEPDTFDVRYFLPENMGLLTPFSDTLLDGRFDLYDPARKQRIDYTQLGNLGTAFHPQLYETWKHKGFDVGFHQYDLYRIHYDDIPFYIVEKPFSDLYFAQGPTQQDTYFKAKFTRNFSNGLNFSIDYKRMNNVGQFKSQAAINTAFGIGFWYHHPNGKYDSFITFASNTNEIEDNGGVDIASLSVVNTDRVFNIPVFLRTANTFYVTREYAYSQQYNLLGKTTGAPKSPPPSANPPGSFPGGIPNSLPDSILMNSIPDSVSVLPPVVSPDTTKTEQVSSKRRLTLGHDLVYRKNTYKFYDTEPPEDTVYYGKDLLIDTRGLRYFIQDNSLENTFSLSTSKDGKESQRDLLEVSLEHQLHFLNQEPVDSTINQLMLGGRWNFAPSERLKVQTQLSYNLWDNFGDYRLAGELFFDLKKAGTFKASAINQLYSPSLIQQRMFISEQEVWNNNFDKTLETSLSATYSLPKFRFSATGQYHLLNNLIYFDTLALPKQTGTPVSILQLVVNQDFKVWKLHLDNTVALQTSTEDVIRLPAVFSKHSLYFEGRIFRKKVMLFRLGLDLRMLDSYFSETYQPLIGQFHLQDSQELDFYPVVDAYTSFKVKNFRFFVRAENLNQLFTTDLYYQVAGYAQPYMTIKFGVSWQLLN